MKNRTGNTTCLLFNFLLLYFSYFLCRAAFLFEHWNLFDTFSWDIVKNILWGGFIFDTSAIMYTNCFWAFLILLPLKLKENESFSKFCKWIFVLVNGICFAANIADISYYSFTGRRTTFSFFSEFSNEGNLLKIFALDAARHWYLVLLFAFILFLLIRYYRKPVDCPGKHYYLLQSVSLLIFLPLCVIGIRGGIGPTVRPISIVNANQYVSNSKQAGVILNTPFSVIRTSSKTPFKDPLYFTKEYLSEIYSPEICFRDSLKFKEKNIVVFIVESLSSEYLDLGYAPFLDSLRSESLTWERSFSNGRKSIDALPSILSSIPMFIEPFFVTSYSTNTVGSFAKELASKNYHTSFFHGSNNSSMGFQAFARSAGFANYFGRTEYNNDSRFNGNSDFDGTWAIWDEQFLKFFALNINNFSRPFVSVLFTASSHHPFAVPQGVPGALSDNEPEIAKCVRYTDQAFRKFFTQARSSDWFDNTIFVFTGDHTNQTLMPEYQTSFGLFSVPIFFFDPSGELGKGVVPGVAQHIDIFPTILSCLGYDNPVISFGQDLLATPKEKQYAVNYVNGVYQYLKGDYLLLFDSEKTLGFYNIRTDWMLKNNLEDTLDVQQQMEKELKAIIQSYMERVSGDCLTVTSCRL